MSTRARAPRHYPEPPPQQEHAGPSAREGVSALRLALALALLLAVAAALAVGGLRYLNIEEIRVPDLVGQNVDVASLSLERSGLTVRTHVQHAPDSPLGSVITQNPEPGTLVRQGRSVSLVVNQPLENVAAPDLGSILHARVARSLEAAGLVLGETSYVYSAAPVGQVVAQEPAAGATLPTGSAVNVAVSRGFQATQREVPRVVGLSLADARRQLAAAGFDNVETVVSSVSRSGVSAVRAQSPEAGQVVLDSLPVSLFYNLVDERVVEIPDLRGMSIFRAQLRLRELGLLPSWITEENDPDRPAGVLEIRPEGWTLEGSPVVLVVNRSGASRADEEALSDMLAEEGVELVEDGADLEPSPAPPPSEAQAGGGRSVEISYPVEELFTNRTYRFRVVVDDERGQRTAHEENVRPGDRVQTRITVYGDAEVSFYLDDEWVFTWFP